MARRIRVGDVIEIITSRGFAYVHITHIHKTERASYGPLVRVLPGFFDSRPSQFDNRGWMFLRYLALRGSEWVKTGV